MFLRAGKHAQLDTVAGVSANVMCGQEGLFGTNSFQVLMDTNKMFETLLPVTAHCRADTEALEDTPVETTSLSAFEKQNIESYSVVSLGDVHENYDAGF